jgi:hypothetical protein
VAYTIKYISGGLIRTEHWAGKFAMAVATAKKAVADKKADRVEIRNEAGELIHSTPRVMYDA